jgi:MFS family permease
VTSSADFSLWRIAVPAFGPTFVWAIGSGAMTPMIPVVALQRGASVQHAAGMVAIQLVSEFLCAFPASFLLDRIGERYCLVLAGLVTSAACTATWLTSSLTIMAISMACLGPANALLLLARSSYLANAAPPQSRGRAMSMLGGTYRLGTLIGPLGCAPALARWGTGAAFAIAATTGVATAVISWSVDLVALESGSCEHSTVTALQVVREQRRVLLTVGVGVVALGLARSARSTVVPLWATAIGLAPAEISLAFGIAAAVEVAVFYPASVAMDRCGRTWVAVSVAWACGLGLVILPMTEALSGLVVVSALMGLGNGLGAGIIMTLGTDAAPARGRTQFLGLWRVMSLVGHNGASIVVAVLSALATLAAASVSLGVVALLGGAWLWHWVPQYDPRNKWGPADPDVSG